MGYERSSHLSLCGLWPRANHYCRKKFLGNSGEQLECSFCNETQAALRRILNAEIRQPSERGKSPLSASVAQRQHRP